MKIINQFAQFNSRESRSQFIYQNYSMILSNSILDVGCYEAPLRKMVNSTKYTGLDIAGKPDVIFNLEGVNRLPFDDKCFHSVLCIEVLEHIDNLHFIFGDLFRCSSKFVLVSLPNSWCNARVKIERGTGDFLHYGLPFERPTDRHKWFFNTSHAIEFFKYVAPSSFNLVQLCTVEKPRNSLLRLLRKARYIGNRYVNRYIHTVFALYEIK